MQQFAIRFGDVDRVKTRYSQQGCEATIRVTHEDIKRFENLPLQHQRPDVKVLTVVYDNERDLLGYPEVSFSRGSIQSPRTPSEYQALLKLIQAMPIYEPDSAQVKSTLVQKTISHFKVFCEKHLGYLGRRKEHLDRDLQQVNDEIAQYQKALAGIEEVLTAPPPDIEYYI